MNGRVRQNLKDEKVNRSISKLYNVIGAQNKEMLNNTREQDSNSPAAVSTDWC